MPSRKIVSIFIVAVGLVAGIILGFGKNSSISAVREIANTGLLSKGPEVTIPENKNWLSDLSPLTLNQTEVSSLEASSTNNLTTQVSESLIANYLSLRQSGTLDSTSAANLVNQAVNFTQSGSASLSAKTYTTADILVSPDNSQEAIRKYGNDLGNAFKINKPAKVKNEIEIFRTMIQSQDKSKITELKEIASVYQNLAVSIKNIKVPSSYLTLHLEILNGLSGIVLSIDNMTVLFEDPLRSMQGTTVYQESFHDFSTAVTNIRLRIIKEDKIIYEQGEGGYYLYYGI